jgi:hypothetical protein
MEESAFQLMDCMGKLQVSGIQQGTLSLSAQPAGMYLLRLGHPINQTIKIMKLD